METGVSPEFDEVKDAEYLEILRTTHPEHDLSVHDMISELSELEQQVTQIMQDTGLATLEKRMEQLKKGLKSVLAKELSDTKDIVKCGGYQLKKSIRKSIDSEALKADNLYDLYCKESVNYTLSKAKLN